MVGAAKLDANIYEDVEADVAANGQAAGTVALVAVAQAIGAIGEGTLGLVTGVVGALVGWLIWAGVTYLIRAKLLGGPLRGELLRTHRSAGALSVLGLSQSCGVKGVAVTLDFAGVMAIQALTSIPRRRFSRCLVGWRWLPVSPRHHAKGRAALTWLPAGQPAAGRRGPSHRSA
jgi:hypothetical protein